MIRKLIFLSIFFLLSIHPQVTLAQSNIGVRLLVGDTTMTLQGKTTPDSQITFMEESAVIGTTVSDSLGDFSKTFVAQDEGIVEIGIFSHDPLTNVTPLTTVSVSLSPAQETIVPNIILPSTIYLASTSIEKGDLFSLDGYASPDSDVRIFVTGVGSYASAQASTSGYWSYVLDTAALTAGEHEIYTKVYTQSNNSSINSETKTFEVVDSTPDSDGSGSGSNSSSAGGGSVISQVVSIIQEILSESPSQTTRALPAWFSYFDIDGSGLIELSELRIALRRWIISVQRSTRDTNCDLNYDGICDIIDFSILLYHIDN